jgi:hypothetical protein
VEDPASSLGGRCIKLKQDFHKNLAAESHRRLAGIPCTYSNGTVGVKCAGYQACSNDDFGTQFINPANVGCGSCNGYKA